MKNTSVEEALKLFRNEFELLNKSEVIEVINSLGRVTSEAVYAKCNSPLYNSAAMDGIAVIAADTEGASETTPLQLDNFLTVDTGDPIYPPYDSVIMAEDIQGDSTIRAAASPWQHIRPVGEDIAKGEMILPGGHEIRPIDIGVLLSGGIVNVMVTAKPTVAVIPTGTEMVEAGEAFKKGDIIESNSGMLEALVLKDGGSPRRFPAVPDEYDKLVKITQKAVQSFDITLVIAGTSAGREDYTSQVLNQLGKVVVHGVAMKPGKPVILAVVNGKAVIGVPGYPVSAYLAYQNFVAPLLGKTAEMATVKATVSRKIVSSLKHKEYVRVRVGQVGPRLVASPLARGAGAAMSLVRADGFCVIPQNHEGVESGEEVDILLSRNPDELKNTVVCTGSHDLILDILADIMPPRANLSGTHVGSMAGLLALKNGECHIAPIHLLNEETGEYNTDFIKNMDVTLIKGVGRTQGIMVKKGNPLGISGFEDLTKYSFINRQRGAGTRLLLDYNLKKLGISPEKINGYEKEAATHMAVAAAVAEGGVDSGLGVFSAAKAMGLDFIPVGEEEYDFAVVTEYLELPHVQVFIEALGSEAFKMRVNELGGYSLP